MLIISAFQEKLGRKGLLKVKQADEDEKWTLNDYTRNQKIWKTKEKCR